MKNGIWEDWEFMVDETRQRAEEPHFYGATYCVRCAKHLPVGEHGEFYWDGPYDPATGRYTDAQKVGT